MSDLAIQQQGLLRALFDWPAENAIEFVAAPALSMGSRGLKAYQTNGHMLAQRALAAAYPVVGQLLGEESFADLARALWHAHPPNRGDLAQWGGDLPAYVADSPQLQDVPYLADVARAEWALHGSATVADAQADPASLALLMTEDPEGLGLLLAPACCVVRSMWPVASLLGAHLRGVPSFADVGAAVSAKEAQDVIVWRQGLRPQWRPAALGEADFLHLLHKGLALAQALDQSPQLDFSQWFPAAVASQLVLGVFVLDLAST
ncbi:MAG: hypothetical protein CFE44_03110 [Burkholderiales bacterium PBB4]|nr:MAG: hypothetical protein CFE44_03110 [Burkholderiales bacterium PBB4]